MAAFLGSEVLAEAVTVDVVELVLPLELLLILEEVSVDLVKLALPLELLLISGCRRIALLARVLSIRVIPPSCLPKLLPLALNVRLSLVMLEVVVDVIRLIALKVEEEMAGGVASMAFFAA